MAFNIDPSISLNVKGQQQYSLGDLLSLAAGAQSYKQAQQLNPLLIQEAQQKLDVAKLNVLNNHYENIAKNTAELMNKPDLTTQDIIDRATEINENAGGNPQSLKQYLIGLPTNGKKEDLKVWLAQAQLNALTAQSKIEKQFPDVQNVDVGGSIASQAKGNPMLAAIQPGTLTGPYVNKTIAPQTYTTETGAPGIIGGGNTPTGGNINQPQNAPQATPQTTTQVQNTNQAIAQKGMLTRDPAETYDAYRERVKRIGALPTASKEALNPANLDSITNMKFINDKVLKLLDKPDLDIGPVQKSISEKTGGIGLNSDQQIIQKYLEQRIRQEGARSNEDQESKRSAYGSFGNSKDALREIIYNDKGTLASKELFARGVLNHQGDPGKPNLANINKFDNDFSQMANDPNVTKLMGIIGNKSKDELSKSDQNYISKTFNNLSNNEKLELIRKLNELKALSSGK